jgi:hypothetical protein
MATATRHGMKTEASITVDRPVEAVWKSMTDPTSFSKWTGFQERQTSPGPFGVGSTFRETRPKTPKTQDFRVTELEPNLKFGLEIFSGPIRGSKISYSLEAIEGKTRLTEIADFNLFGIYKLFKPFVDRPGKAEKEATDRLVGLKHTVESETKS